MRDIRVMIWGFGAMGSGIARMLLKKTGVEIVGVVVGRKHLHGTDVYQYLGEERGSRPELLFGGTELIRNGACDVVLLGTDSFTRSAFEKVKLCVEHGLNVITTAEEMAWPWAQEPELSLEIDRLARRHGVTVFGTGINPGFVLDLLILAITGTCEDVKSIEAARINDLSPFGGAVMHEQGVGITPEEFKRRLAANDLAGHVGFPESISAIAAGLGVEITKIEQTKDPIISKVHRETPYAKVEPGNLAGIRQQGWGRTADGRAFIHLDHPQQVRPEAEGIETGDYITIDAGGYTLKFSGKPEMPGGIGTIAMVVNMIPQVLNAPAGLTDLLELPIPHAILGDMNRFVHELREERRVYHKGDCVVLHIELLPAGERAAGVPEDTAALPLEMWVKGELLAESAHTGEVVRVRTAIGREVEGTLTNCDPGYQHDFGSYVPELAQVHRQVVDILSGKGAC